MQFLCSLVYHVVGELMRQITTISQQAYEIIKEDIFSGRYAPGSWLQEKTIAEELGISRSPVREALRMLVADGIATVTPNKGIFVRTYTPKDIENIFEVREAIENYAMIHTRPEVIQQHRAQLEEEISQFHKLHRTDDLETYIRLDANFHHQIVEMNANDLMTSLYEKAENQNHQFRIISLTSQKRFDESEQEHAAILENLLSGRKKEACKVNSRHLSLARDQVIDYLNHQSDPAQNS